MPLRCIDEVGESVHSFEIEHERWNALREENKRHQHLRLPCCGGGTVLKTSRLGTHFFAHHKNGECGGAPESLDHLQIKEIVAKEMRECGWHAETEVTGYCPNGEQWRTDVLASKANVKVAVEVQWSPESIDVILDRQSRYKRSGIRGLWLIKQPGFPISKDLPAACVYLPKDEKQYTVLIPYFANLKARDRQNASNWVKRTSVTAFIRAALEARLRWGVKAGQNATATVYAAQARCWRCKSETELVTRIDLDIESIPYSLSIYDFEHKPRLLYFLLPGDLKSAGVGVIKSRYSKTMGEAYVSNGCVSCDAIQGRFYDHEVAYDAKPLKETTFVLDNDWVATIDAACGDSYTWNIASGQTRLGEKTNTSNGD